MNSSKRDKNMQEKTPPGWSRIGDDNNRQPLDSKSVLHLWRADNFASRPPVLGPMSTESLHSDVAALWDSDLQFQSTPVIADEPPLKFCKDCKNLNPHGPWCDAPETFSTTVSLVYGEENARRPDIKLETIPSIFMGFTYNFRIVLAEDMRVNESMCGREAKWFAQRTEQKKESLACKWLWPSMFGVSLLALGALLLWML